MDGLFVWLATIATHMHLNYVHFDGVWTSRASDSPNLQDKLVVTTQMHFLAAKAKNQKATKLDIKDGFNDPQDTESQFMCQPEVLRYPVRDVAA